MLMYFVNLGMYMSKMGLIISIKVVDLCFSFLNKETMHKTEFYNFSYNQNTK
jgi:hypothetical protein